MAQAGEGETEDSWTIKQGGREVLRNYPTYIYGTTALSHASVGVVLQWFEDTSVRDAKRIIEAFTLGREFKLKKEEKKE